MRLSCLILVAFFLVSCNDNYTPKPRAFFKIDLPNKHNVEIDIDCPFTFEKPHYSVLERQNQPCFYNLNFPNQNGILHITYLPLNNNLLEHTEESRRLAFNHNVMADAIIEKVYINEAHQVYGMLYDYDGVTATSTQFYLTDSITHFFRGALYFNTEISDSLLPVNNFLKQDVKNIIESFKWIN
tara:strand:+ start:3076 stop:3627 length:552 start_codon:yes stop_codon:yes gene_type:complete